MKTHFTKVLIPLVVLALAIPACGPQVTVTTFGTGTPCVISLFTPTPVTRSLKVCLGEERNSL